MLLQILAHARRVLHERHAQRAKAFVVADAGAFQQRRCRHRTGAHENFAPRDESFADNRAFSRELDSLGVRHEFREFAGSHDWNYWRLHLHESLVAVTRDMR